MSWRGMLICSLVVVSAAAASAAQSLRSKSDQEVLVKLERDWLAALHRGDLEFIGNILADEYLATYTDGSRADRAREMKLAAEFSQLIDSSNVDEFTVKVYGDTAVVWFTQQLTGVSQGKPKTITNRYTDLFVMRDGRWQCVASHSTRVGES